MSLYHHHCQLIWSLIHHHHYHLDRADALPPCLAECAVSSLPTSELSSCTSCLASRPSRHTSKQSDRLSAQLDDKVFPSRGKTFAEHNQRWKGDIICNHPTVIEYIVSVLKKKKRKKSQMLLFTTWWWWLRPRPVEWLIDRYTWSLQSEAWSPALSMQQGQGLQQRNPAFNDCSLYFYDPVQHWLFCCDSLL